MPTIHENIDTIKREIAVLLKNIHREKPVQLIAVSKTVDIDRVKEATLGGQLLFGENRPQELKKKYEEFHEGISYHMIGNLQRNKIKDVLGRAELIHSLDRVDLLESIEKRALRDNCYVKGLFQLNIAEEDTKFGANLEELDQLIDCVESLSRIKIEGLMTIAPYAENPEEIRWVFKKAKEIFDSLGAKQFKNISMQHLSMGMSHDYKIAIEEGATMIRIGTAIFGERKYQ